VYERILIPTDGSEAAARAFDHAFSLAETYDAELHALYVVDIDSTSFRLGSETVEKTHDAALSDLPPYLRGEGSDAFARIEERADASGLSVETHVAVGAPHREIAHLVEREGIDLVTMASHGRGGVGRLLLGSVTERTVRTVTVPVLVVDVREERTNESENETA
jgi:nucleotide-binding universal stress UspA family protein